MRLFSTLFWGIFLLASGAILLLKYVFNLHWVNGGKLIFGLFIVLVGISLLTGNFGWFNFNSSDENVTMFTSNRQVDAADGKEYTVLFGSGEYDLTDLPQGARVKVNCIFGSCRLKLPSGPVDVSADCAFGNVSLPNGSISFGNLPYIREGENKTRVEVSVAFGSAKASE
jgi:hypothetical protein